MLKLIKLDELERPFAIDITSIASITCISEYAGYDKYHAQFRIATSHETHYFSLRKTYDTKTEATNDANNLLPELYAQLTEPKPPFKG